MASEEAAPASVVPLEVHEFFVFVDTIMIQKKIENRIFICFCMFLYLTFRNCVFDIENALWMR